MNSEIERKNMKKTFTEKLFAPSVPVESREERRRMEFLLKLLLAVMAVIVWFMLMLTVFIGPAAAIKDLDFILSLIAFIMAITAFRLAKFGHVKLSSYFIVISFTLIIYLMSLLNLMGYSTMYDKNDLNILLFLFFPILGFIPKLF